MLAGYNERCRIDIDLMQFSSQGDGIPLPKRRRPFDVGRIIFTSPNPSYTILISLRYSGRRRIDIDPMQFCDLGNILWYGKLFWYEYIMGYGQLEVIMQNIHIFVFWR